MITNIIKVYHRLISTILLSLLIINVSAQSEDCLFESSWKSQTHSQHWVGSDFWSNPLQDWQIANGRLECNASQPNRNVKLLTQEITGKSNFSMSVDIGHELPDTMKMHPNSMAGFFLGAHGDFNHYLDKAIAYKHGLRAGICPNGELLLINKSPIDQRVMVDSTLLRNGITLKLSATLINEKYVLILSASKRDSGELIGQIMKEQVLAKRLIGLPALLTHFPGKAGIESTNHPVKGFWFQNFKIFGSARAVAKRPNRAIGPLLFAKYLYHNNKLHLSAQLNPINVAAFSPASLQFEREDGSWTTVAYSQVDPQIHTATFIVDWYSKAEANYRVCISGLNAEEEPQCISGHITQEPLAQEQIRMLAFSCVDDYGFPHREVVKAAQYHNPDILFFAGDQIYEATIYGTVDRNTPLTTALLDYHSKWNAFGYAFRELLMNYPSVILTDDHDVYHGNLFGNGGTAADLHETKDLSQNTGGYLMSNEFVNLVQKSQTGHLPAPASKTQIGTGIDTYYTHLDFAGISFAMLEDRKFKTGHSVESLRYQEPLDFDSGQLLGSEQLNFLEQWATDWSSSTMMKVVLSQTLFGQFSTRPPDKFEIPAPDIYPEHILEKDIDCNGYPKARRDQIIELMRKGLAIHICGDRHLGVSGQYGIDNWRDGPYVLATPAVSSIMARLWFPPMLPNQVIPGRSRNIGDFEDFYKNKFSVDAVMNAHITGIKPAKLYDKAPGYGVIDFNKRTRETTMSVWQRQVNPAEPAASPYKGWPIKIHQFESYRQGSKYELPVISVEGLENPMIEVIKAKSQELVYTTRMNGSVFLPFVFEPGKYIVRVGNDKDFQVIECEARAKDEEHTKFIKFD